MSLRCHPPRPLARAAPRGCFVCVKRLLGLMFQTSPCHRLSLCSQRSGQRVTSDRYRRLSRGSHPATLQDLARSNSRFKLHRETRAAPIAAQIRTACSSTRKLRPMPSFCTPSVHHHRPSVDLSRSSAGRHCKIESAIEDRT